jgi:SPASM domain peptide maturase of grasp-with-spasm system
MSNTVFKLFATCLPVKGINRSIICNTWKYKFRYIPNALYFILTKCEGMTIEEIKEKFQHKNDEIIDEYFLFLKENEFGFYCSKEELKLFPKLNLNFETPNFISNCIIDINNESKFDCGIIYNQLANYNCYHYQLRFYDSCDCEKLNEALKETLNYPIKSINIILPYNKNIEEKEFISIYYKYQLTEISCYSTPLFKLEYLKKIYLDFPFIFYTEKITNETSCGNINANKFNTEFTSFSESQNYNSCLNRKISIDVNGEIKNCPSMAKSYGNIKNTTLEEALEKKGFKDV